ncbi:MFS transporter [Haloprofundus salilacus]|uniref:MFS transporter n=1 Tax=Haloprofundus salilacus TaxID=2876190 RepID=UPI001CCB8FF0|nr:MFS transporter [Haloprofundus salilacus]
MGLSTRLFGDDAALLSNRSFQLLLLASVSSPLGSSVVSPVLDSLRGPLGATEAQVALLMAAFTAPAIVCIPLVGMLSDRYGRKPVLTAGLTLFGLAGIAIPLTTEFRVVVGLRLLQGVGYTGIAPVLITSVGDLFDGDREAAAQGLRFTTVGLSLTVFPLLAGALVALSWRYPFYLFALALPTALAVALFFDDPTLDSEGAGDTVETATNGGEATEDTSPPDDDSPSTLQALSVVLRNRRVAATLLGRAVPSFLWFTFLTYVSIVVARVLGGSAGEAGVLVALASVASSVSATQVGRLTAAFDRRAIPLFATLVCTAVGVAALGLSPSLPVAGLGSVAVGAGFGVVLSLYRSTISTLATDELRGSLVSVGESLGRVGSTTAPILLGGTVALLEPRLGSVVAIRSMLVGVAVLTVVVGGFFLYLGETGDGRSVTGEA